MKPVPQHSHPTPRAATLAVLAVVFSALLTLSPRPAPARMIPVTGAAEAGGFFQTIQIALNTFFSGPVDGSPRAIESANRLIQAAGWYREAGDSADGAEITIIPNADRTLEAFGGRWVEAAPHRYRQEGSGGSLRFLTSERGEISAVVWNESRVYRRLSWTQTAFFKTGLLITGLLAALGAACYRLRHPRKA